MDSPAPIAPPVDPASGDAVPATQAWCVVCRAWRPYRNEPVHRASFKAKPGFSADDLKCVGCSTTLLSVRAALPDEA